MVRSGWLVPCVRTVRSIRCITLHRALKGRRAVHGEATSPVSSIAARLIASVDWRAYEEHDGPAASIGSALQELLTSANAHEASLAWVGIEEHVFSQGTIYSVAEPAVAVMLAALTEDQPPWRCGRIVDLLYFVVIGESALDPTLQDRCRARAREGLWLLARWALTHSGWERDNALEVIGVVAPESIEPIREGILTR